MGSPAAASASVSVVVSEKRSGSTGASDSRSAVRSTRRPELRSGASKPPSHRTAARKSAFIPERARGSLGPNPGRAPMACRAPSRTSVTNSGRASGGIRPIRVDEGQQRAPGLGGSGLDRRAVAHPAQREHPRARSPRPLPGAIPGAIVHHEDLVRLSRQRLVHPLHHPGDGSCLVPRGDDDADHPGVASEAGGGPPHLPQRPHQHGQPPERRAHHRHRHQPAPVHSPKAHEQGREQMHEGRHRGPENHPHLEPHRQRGEHEQVPHDEQHHGHGEQVEVERLHHLPRGLLQPQGRGRPRLRGQFHRGALRGQLQGGASRRLRGRGGGYGASAVVVRGPARGQAAERVRVQPHRGAEPQPEEEQEAGVEHARLEREAGDGKGPGELTHDEGYPLLRPGLRTSSSSRMRARRTPTAMARDEMVAPVTTSMSLPARTGSFTVLPSNWRRKRGSVISWP